MKLCSSRTKQHQVRYIMPAYRDKARMSLAVFRMSQADTHVDGLLHIRDARDAHELVDDVPEPAVGQLHVDVAVQDDAEEGLVVGPGFAPRVQARLLHRVQVPEVHLLPRAKLIDQALAAREMQLRMASADGKVRPKEAARLRRQSHTFQSM